MVSADASNRMHSRMGMVVLDDTAFKTMLMPFIKFSFLNVRFINVDNSFAVDGALEKEIHSSFS